jgi:tRNA A-37 threonylcarbamoyl transferase component Bud32
MPTLEIAADYRDLFRRHGLATADDFLAWAGTAIGGHADRHVVAVSLAGLSFFLKKERIVPWRDRFASAWHGHGWASKSVREARLLQQAQAAGIGCPEVAAVGEDRPRAFLLLRAADGMAEVRDWLARPLSAAARRALARTLGQALARLHGAGFDHPDLYVKHVLAAAEGEGFRFCFLDWQRSRWTIRVPWRRRLRDLAALDASLGDGLATARLRLDCLRAYLARAEMPPPLARAAAAVRRLSLHLLRRRKVRALRHHGAPAEVPR